jgi:hypothetical protein
MTSETPPRMLGGGRVLKYARVTPDVRPTGATRHILPSGVAGPAAALAIVEDAEDTGGFFLFGLDATGSVETDTWHESLDDALDQAAFEYVGLTWTDLPA